MHTYDYEDPEIGSIYMHHNGDYSGNVHININRIALQDDVFYDKDRIEVHVPFKAMKALVISMIRSEMIGQLEQMDDDKMIQFFIGRAATT